MSRPTPPNLPAFIAWCLETGKPSSLEYEPWPWDTEKLHSSDLGQVEYGCLLQVWLRLRGAEAKPESPGQALMFYKAHLIHLSYQEWMLRHLEAWSGGEWRGMYAEEPVYLGELGRAGSCDMLIRHEPSKTYVVVDFKSQRAAAFKYSDGVKPQYVPQVSDYAGQLGAAYSLVLVTDREGSNFIDQYVVEVVDTEPLWQRLERAARGASPPPAIAPAKGKLPWQCDYCKYLGISCGGALNPWISLPEVKP